MLSPIVELRSRKNLQLIHAFRHVGDAACWLALSSAPHTRPGIPLRAPTDPNARIKALQDDVRSHKERQNTEFSELVLAAGADSLALGPLVGVLLTAVKQSHEETEDVTR